MSVTSNLRNNEPVASDLGKHLEKGGIKIHDLEKIIISNFFQIYPKFI